MTANRHASGYLVGVSVPGAPPETAERLAAVLGERGWSPAARRGRLWLFLSPGSALPHRALGRSGLLVGRYHPSRTDLFDDLEADRAERLIGGGWGRYVAVWADGPETTVLRDPGGGLDALVWESGPWRLIASELLPDLDGLLPHATAIDGAQVGAVLRSAAAASAEPALIGVRAVPPGVRLRLRPSGAAVDALWTPAAAARACAPDAAPEALREVVDRVVGALAAPHARLVGEISGGFDSAVVATATAAVAPGRSDRWLNFHAAAPEADERAYARAVAAAAGLALEIRRKRPSGLIEADLEAAACGARPGLQALDPEYDADVAGRMRADGATALLTGQGGDACFFQYGTPALVVDRVRRLGLRGLGPRFLHQTARWTRYPAWDLLDVGLRARFGLRQRRADDEEEEEEETREPAGVSHPWEAGLSDLPPAKRGQVRQLINCQVFWGDCRRARAGELLHPLLSQPVMAHCLALPADVLTQGGRDRALARAAFADRLPDAVLGRRGKGELSGHYGQVVAASLPFARDLLLDGRLVQAGLIDRAETEALLDPDALLWSGAYNTVLIRMAVELWVRRWSERLARRKPLI